MLLLMLFFQPCFLVAQVEKNKKVDLNTYSDDELRLAKLIKPNYIKADSIRRVITKKYDILNKLSDPSAGNTVQSDIEGLSKIKVLLYSQIDTIKFNFIRDNPFSFFSLDLLTLILKNSEGQEIIETINSLFNSLNKNIQNSTSGRKFKSLLLTKKKTAVGNLAPDFNVTDINDKVISLSDFRNEQFVILDFWASWCKPCRDDIPSLKAIYEAYNHKGLEIIGISIDDDLLSWKNAIANEGTQLWRHISVPLKNRETDDFAITNKYFVYGIPVKILINKEGVIIGRWTGRTDENIAQLKELLVEKFNK